jgi:hypothetical protein
MTIKQLEGDAAGYGLDEERERGAHWSPSLPTLPDRRTQRARMSLLRHAEVRSDSFTGRGYFPQRIPPHQVDLLTGIISSTCGNRKKIGSSDITILLREETLRGRP